MSQRYINPSKINWHVHRPSLEHYLIVGEVKAQDSLDKRPIRISTGRILDKLLFESASELTTLILLLCKEIEVVLGEAISQELVTQ